MFQLILWRRESAVYVLGKSRDETIWDAYIYGVIKTECDEYFMYVEWQRLQVKSICKDLRFREENTWWRMNWIKHLVGFVVKCVDLFISNRYGYRYHMKMVCSTMFPLAYKVSL